MFFANQYAWINTHGKIWTWINTSLPVLTNALVHMFSVCLFSSSKTRMRQAVINKNIIGRTNASN
jgi:hypothetical protein